MPVDPRLSGVVLGADPRDAQLAALRQEMADMRREIRDLRSAATIQVGPGAPSSASRDGTPYGDSTNVRLWLRLGATWRYTTLT